MIAPLRHQPAYAELQVTSHFSFLRGASSAEELFATAALMGIEALGITDRNSLAGIVRAHQAAKDTGVRLVVGCRLDLADSLPLLVYPTDLAAYSRLCRLLSLGKKRAGKGACHLKWDDLAHFETGLLAVLLPDAADETCARELDRLSEVFGDRAYLALTLRRRPGDRLRLHRLSNLAVQRRVRTIVTNDVLFHAPSRRILQDVVTAIRHNVTIDELGFRRERHADRHLKPPEEMHRLFSRHPDALARTMEIGERCRFTLDDIAYQYPEEREDPTLTPQQTLEKLTWAGAAEHYADGVPDDVRKSLEHELGLIAKLEYAPYFLTVHSIVRFARSQQILCQGRGSAANSAVCFVLGITAIDPKSINLLFERFVSEERREPPDIDVDFEHQRREEVIQWIYETYGRDRAALCATVIRYRTKGALRDVGKALGLPEDVISTISAQVWGWSEGPVDPKHLKEVNLNLDDRRLRLALELAGELRGAPRHLSQHPGGFVLTRDRLDDLVPIKPAAMDDRQVIEWDKDDIDILKFMKVDVLALGMLSCMRRGLDLLAEHKGEAHSLASIPDEDPETYAMIRKADTLGTFQIESRAQMSMLPRLKPKTYYDLVIQVAIVRPGPIQGDMVHPYLRRREGLEQPDYPKPELRKVLEKTLGVPLFQEQAMRVAIECAGFTPSEADSLRRSMATFKMTGGVSAFRDKLVAGMVANGYERDFAERTFRQLEGFGSYGFPESHAASFAKIAYASAWLKCRHPDVFCAALLNSQPMGFYAPAQIVRDAREHGVEIRPVCVVHSQWDCTLEPCEQTVGQESSGLRKGADAAASFSPLVGEMGGNPEGGATPSLRGFPPAYPPLPCRASPPQGGRSGQSPRAALFNQSSDGNDHFLAVRLGLRMVKGLSERDAAALVAARETAPFSSPEDLWRRTRIPVAALTKLAEADGFAALGLNRREALWAVKALRDAPLPLFAAATEREERAGDDIRRSEFTEPAVSLRPMTKGAEVVGDYRHVGLSLREHPVSFLRQDLKKRRMITCAEAMATPGGRWVEAAGLVLVRQRPGSAKGVMFITMEDESGIANLVVWPKVFEKNRRIVLTASMIAATGRIQREGDVVHLVVHRLTDLSPELASVGDRGGVAPPPDFPLPHGRGDEFHHGSPTPDPRDKAQRATRTRDIYTRDLPLNTIRVKSRNFH